MYSTDKRDISGQSTAAVWSSGRRYTDYYYWTICECELCQSGLLRTI